MSGWKNAIQYARGLVTKHTSDDNENIQAADDGLPLNARIGSVIRAPESVFVRANVTGSLINMTGTEDMRVKAVSKLKLGQSGDIFRLYMETGDVTGQEKFLQLYRSPRGDVEEMLFCTRLTRIIPETVEDQDAFTGAAGTGLGLSTYSLYREVLAADGIDELDLQRVFGEKESLEFRRDKGDSSVEFVPPMHGKEIRVDDSSGEKGLEQEVYYMPYVRYLAGDSLEYLLITTEIVVSRDGDRNKRSIHVDFMIGIPVSQERVSII